MHQNAVAMELWMLLWSLSISDYGNICPHSVILFIVHECLCSSANACFFVFLLFLLGVCKKERESLCWFHLRNDEHWRDTSTLEFLMHVFLYWRPMKIKLICIAYVCLHCGSPCAIFALFLFPLFHQAYMSNFSHWKHIPTERNDEKKEKHFQCQCCTTII